VKNLVYFAALIVALVFVDVASAQIQIGLFNRNNGGNARAQIGLVNRNDAGFAQQRVQRGQQVQVVQKVQRVQVVQQVHGHQQVQFVQQAHHVVVPQVQQVFVAQQVYHPQVANVACVNGVCSQQLVVPQAVQFVSPPCR
jgi:hypothetical protein